MKILTWVDLKFQDLILLVAPESVERLLVVVAPHALARLKIPHWRRRPTWVLRWRLSRATTAGPTKSVPWNMFKPEFEYKVKSVLVKLCQNGFYMFQYCSLQNLRSFGCLLIIFLDPQRLLKNQFSLQH